MHVFTSITANYIPKARVLARSVKRHHPEARFHLVLCDRRPEGFGPGEPFDRVIGLEDLGLPVASLDAWTFQHTVVELCTAVKGQAFCHLFDTTDAEAVVYLDPDVVVYHPLRAVEAALGTHEVVLTPHLTSPETTRDAILDNERSVLKYGIFNLGFLAVRRGDEGARFLAWWRDRLLAFCHDDLPNGLFTDQKWIDLAPALFDVHILKDPAYNVATWNIGHRPVALDAAGAPTVAGRPLAFFHFSGYDSGAHIAMRDKYGAGNAALRHLSEGYAQALEEAGQKTWGHHPWAYGRYSDGTPIERRHRELYRSREDLQRAFDRPAVVTGDHRCYKSWWGANAHEPAAPEAAPSWGWLRRRVPAPLKLALRQIVRRAKASAQ